MELACIAAAFAIPLFGLWYFPNRPKRPCPPEWSSPEWLHGRAELPRHS